MVFLPSALQLVSHSLPRVYYFFFFFFFLKPDRLPAEAEVPSARNSRSQPAFSLWRNMFLFIHGASADLSFFALGDSMSITFMKSLCSLMLLRTPSLPVIFPFGF